MSDGNLQAKCPAEREDVCAAFITVDKCKRYLLQTEKLCALCVTNNAYK